MDWKKIPSFAVACKNVIGSSDFRAEVNALERDPWREIRMRRLEMIIPKNVPGKGARNAQVAFNERPVDDEHRLVVCVLLRAPGLDLLAERIEIPLNAVPAERTCNMMWISAVRRRVRVPA